MDLKQRRVTHPIVDLVTRSAAQVRTAGASHSSSAAWDLHDKALEHLLARSRG
jgi:hypothetical protein